MTFLPVVARELRVASRRRMTYWSRFFTASIAIVIGWIVFTFPGHVVASHLLGKDMFSVLSWAAFIYCLGTGIRSTADCLSEEKREGTLGLLFLTDLKGYDVVGGKLVATSLNAFYGLLAIFPVLAIPLLMGGITNGEFWRMALVLTNTFLLSLSVGMFMSSICTSPRKAMAGTLIVMLFLSVGIPAAEEWFTYVARSPHLAAVLDFMNPYKAFSLVEDANYAASKAQFWWFVGVIHGMGWLLLAIASFIVPRSWQDHPAGEKKQQWRERWHRWSYGDAAERDAFRRRLLDINAFYWLAGRARLKPLHVWVALTIVAMLWCWGAVNHGSEWMNGAAYFITALLLNGMLKVWITSEAGRRLGEDRKMGALELLLSTPLSVPDILRGQILALKRQFQMPLLVVLAVEFVFMLAAVQNSYGDGEEATLSVTCGIVMMVMLVADVLALVALAMWTSLTTKNPNRTTGIALRRILVLPWVIYFAVLFWILLAAVAGHATQEPGWKFFVGLYFFIGIVTDLVFGLRAWQRLNAEFREVAAQRFTAQPPSWLRQLVNREKYAPAPPPATAP